MPHLWFFFPSSSVWRQFTCTPPRTKVLIRPQELSLSSILSAAQGPHVLSGRQLRTSTVRSERRGGGVNSTSLTSRRQCPARCFPSVEGFERAAALRNKVRRVAPAVWTVQHPTHRCSFMPRTLSLSYLEVDDSISLRLGLVASGELRHSSLTAN